MLKKESISLEPIKTRYPGELPIYSQQSCIMDAIRQHPVIVIAGETGSGKTTQIPKFLIDAGLAEKGCIACTQPRRVAALSVAKRIAEELELPFGTTIGAKIRFTDHSNQQTRVKVMTDGILLNEIQEDPNLSQYSAIVIDEAHERSLNIDFILGHLRTLIERRSDLKVIITSATIDTESFSQAFNHAPIIEVSGRTYPVELHYRPPEELCDPSGTTLNLEQATLHTIEHILQNYTRGDLLAFLASEREIHDLKAKLTPVAGRSCQILPLYGRLMNTEQQKIFQAGSARRIILATNIAETSLTVPGIRFVVDTGRARISRYSPQSRTLRLPIEAIAQSSANQRMGRCGRTHEGICFRLYSEQDFLERPQFTTPEIHRSNLASVILRLLAFKLGDPAQFPFIDAPSPAAIQGGYRLLEELGAVYRRPNSSDNSPTDYKLSKIGRQLAAIPVDPTSARMLVHARQEKVLQPVLVIAAGLSIPDPRERPADHLELAEQQQAIFRHPKSDFLSLLTIWNQFQQWQSDSSQGQLRKHCKQHFLAYQRMREWQDLYRQLAAMMGFTDRKAREPAASNTPSLDPIAEDSELYAAIHRSILAGFLNNIAHKTEGHQYQGTRNRKASLFPGSNLFDKASAKKIRKAQLSKKKAAKIKTSAPQWIVCGEWMETQRLFARTAAHVQLDWILEMGKDRMHTRHSEPFWSESAAAVLCQQRSLLFGLEIQRSQVRYTPIDPEVSTDIFVRKGLVEQGILERPHFLEHNAQLTQLAESELVRLRMGSSERIEDQLYDYYRKRLEAVGSYAELRRYAKSKHQGRMDFLCAALSDLIPQQKDAHLDAQFPAQIAFCDSQLKLVYQNTVAIDASNVRLQVPIQQLAAIQQATLDWAVPGRVYAMIEFYLRALPKSLRIALHPLKERAESLRQQLQPSTIPLAQQIANALQQSEQMNLHGAILAPEALPIHLRPEIEVLDAQAQPLFSGHNLNKLQQQAQSYLNSSQHSELSGQMPAWKAAAAKYERFDLQDWTIGDLPESIDLSRPGALPLKAYPSLVAEADSIHLKLLPSREQALEASEEAWPLLAERCLARDLAWMRHELKGLKKLGLLLLPLGGAEKVQKQAYTMLRRSLCTPQQCLPLKAAHFATNLGQAKAQMTSQTHAMIRILEELLQMRQRVQHILDVKQSHDAIRYPNMERQLLQLAPPELLTGYQLAQLPAIVRFLRAMIIRAERAKLNIAKDMEKAKRIAPHEADYQSLQSLKHPTKQQLAGIQDYFILLEEFKVSVFAQELGTGQKVSPKRLEQLAKRIRES